MIEDHANREAVRNIVHDDVGLDLTQDQLNELCSDPHVVAEVEEWGVFDTQTRERITDALCKKILNRRWPLYGDAKDYKEAFYADFEREALAKGYRKAK